MKGILLKRLQPRFIGLIREIQSKNNLTQRELAKRLGIQETHFSAILANRMPLSTTYVGSCIWGGFLTVEQIYDEQSASQKETEWWTQMRLVQRRTLEARLQRLADKFGGPDGLEAKLEALENGTICKEQNGGTTGGGDPQSTDN